jgi:hypothetical protein
MYVCVYGERERERGVVGGGLKKKDIPSALSSMTTGTKNERKNWFIAFTYNTAAYEFF